MAKFEESTRFHRFTAKPISFRFYTVTDTISCSIPWCPLAWLTLTRTIIDPLHWRRITILVGFSEVEGQFYRPILRLAALLKPFGCDTE